MSRILVGHPSPDLYGSDLQLVESVRGLIASGHEVTVCVPREGPLVPRLTEAGASIIVVGFRVLRRALLTPRGIIRTAITTPRRVLRIRRVIKDFEPDVVYVNTTTIPWWVLAGRLARRPVLVHVHEAEEAWPRLLRFALAIPLLLADSVMANSEASRRVLVEAVPMLRRRISVVYNGIAGPPGDDHVDASVAGGSPRLALVARLSPRKGIDVALEAVAILREEGRQVTLDVCGETYLGYEWFEDELRQRSERPDLARAVTFHGYVNPTWPILSAATAVLVPSRLEPFGNTAVEGQLACRPVIASSVQGLMEIITDGHTGFLVPPGDARALADAIAKVIDNPRASAAVAVNGQIEAMSRFSVRRYHRDLRTAVHKISAEQTRSA